jgi:hypothetical protein
MTDTRKEVITMTAEMWITRQEVADRLRIPKQTVAQWTSQGRGPR